MNIINLFLTGLAWIMSACIIISVIAGALLATWMQVNDGKEAMHEQKASAQESISAYPAKKRRRRTAAAHYPCQMP